MPVGEQRSIRERLGTLWRWLSLGPLWRWVRRRNLSLPVALRDHPAVRAGVLGVVILLVALTGAVAGLLVNGQVQHDVGPFQAELAVTPSLTGETKVEIPPLGSLTLDSHDGPASLLVRLDELDPLRTQRLFADPAVVEQASRTAMADIESGVKRVALNASGSALLGALMLATLVFRRNIRRVAAAGAVTIGLVAASAGVGYATFSPRSIEEPRYEGLLTNAPAVVGDARRIASRYDEYRAELQRLVLNVSRLYTTASNLQVYEPEADTVRVLHVSDLHLNPAAFDLILAVSEQFDVDVVVDTGDITDWGSVREGTTYAAGVGRIDAPYIYVRGNHDSAAVEAAVAEQDNAIVLDDHVGTVAGLTFAGIGDPRFTPDKSRTDAYTEAGLRLHTRTLVQTIAQRHQPVDVALVHDPVSAAPLDGVTPLVLAGHKHRRSVTRLDQGTMLMVEGSTGGAGLRGLETREPTPLQLSVLYFDRKSRALQAYDDISVGGAGQAQVTLQRHVLEVRPGAAAPASSSRSPAR